MLQNQRTPDKNKQKNYGMSAQNFKNLPEKIEKTADITKEQLAFLLATEDDAMIQDLKQRARNTGANCAMTELFKVIRLTRSISAYS